MSFYIAGLNPVGNKVSMDLTDKDIQYLAELVRKDLRYRKGRNDARHLPWSDSTAMVMGKRLMDNLNHLIGRR